VTNPNVFPRFLKAGTEPITVYPRFLVDSFVQFVLAKTLIQSFVQSRLVADVATIQFQRPGTTTTLNQAAEELIAARQGTKLILSSNQQSDEPTQTRQPKSSLTKTHQREQVVVESRQPRSNISAGRSKGSFSQTRQGSGTITKK